MYWAIIMFWFVSSSSESCSFPESFRIDILSLSSSSRGSSTAAPADVALAPAVSDFKPSYCFTLELLGYAWSLSKLRLSSESFPSASGSYVLTTGVDSVFAIFEGSFFTDGFLSKFNSSASFEFYLSRSSPGVLNSVFCFLLFASSSFDPGNGLLVPTLIYGEPYKWFFY